MAERAELIEHGTTTEADVPVPPRRPRWVVVLAVTMAAVAALAVLRLVAHGMGVEISPEISGLQVKAQMLDCKMPNEAGEGRACSEDELKEIHEHHGWAVDRMLMGKAGVINADEMIAVPECA
eukprot:CAMPEP_0197662108 /NCGR_PEP_ID=MMETSP1338-20131121/52139_1 /TAXON_ID=43686 ORGANISM="Pelagodinium beii, Strain RCC1491" /NCGR_SAMPLE_ID=MMETSP1338 /ASSEMBLY_ACC=CAM_ASM_000754 /LENGTH=122 /DNA_ID=CAMNT_0043239819 /DNA_START=40 /DNA_END=406 /DNA_ORIENTATION=+